MSVALQRLDGVESAKVSLNDGRADVDLRPGNTVTLDQVRHGIEKSGFSPREARVTARGEIVEADEAIRFRLSGTGETYLVELAQPGATAGLTGLAGQTLIVEGVVPRKEAREAEPVLRLESYRLDAEEEDR